MTYKHPEGLISVHIIYQPLGRCKQGKTIAPTEVSLLFCYSLDEALRKAYNESIMQMRKECRSCI